MLRRRWSSLWLAAVLVFTLTEAQQQHRSPPLFPRRDYGRPGLCPFVTRMPLGHHPPHMPMGNSGEPPSLCGNLCTSDHQCPPEQKCCPTQCGYGCFDPVYIVD